VPEPTLTLPVCESRLVAEVPYSNQYLVARPSGLTEPPKVAVVGPTEET
jgi:hypothetical protein